MKNLRRKIERDPHDPRIIETVLGVGYRFTPASDFNASFTIAPTSSVTNAQGVVVDHKPRNLQLMYSYRF